MSKLNITNQVLQDYDRKNEYDSRLAIQNQLNALSEGKMVARYNATTTMPTTGVYAVGDFVPNSTPTELGSAGSKYILLGWTCVAAPLTFVQTRALTGN